MIYTQFVLITDFFIHLESGYLNIYIHYNYSYFHIVLLLWSKYQKERNLITNLQKYFKHLDNSYSSRSLLNLISVYLIYSSSWTCFFFFSSKPFLHNTQTSMLFFSRLFYCLLSLSSTTKKENNMLIKFRASINLQ